MFVHKPIGVGLLAVFLAQVCFISAKSLPSSDELTDEFNDDLTDDSIDAHESMKKNLHETHDGTREKLGGQMNTLNRLGSLLEYRKQQVTDFLSSEASTSPAATIQQLDEKIDTVFTTAKDELKALTENADMLLGDLKQKMESVPKSVESPLKTRGLFGVPGATPTNAEAVDVAVAHAAKQHGVELDPNTPEKPHEAIKKILNEAKFGAKVIFDAQRKTLEELESLINERKRVTEELFQSEDSTEVRDAVNETDDEIDSVLAQAKDELKAHSDHADKNLTGMLKKMEKVEAALSKDAKRA